ncbi:fatty acid desaturase [Maricaulis sp.]|uniref:fatty acid desaturase family protein n=1 Tax=unclassified Maricaulis TaxID=2632371 RepID=UPI001B147E4F|nr:fatty acid desaturase [Maricaulis sp.]MBO6796466.1 fatty acid desaturase [Maricaulis sp.]
MTGRIINEKHEARALTPEVAWPTLGFLAVLVTVHWSMIWLVLSGAVVLGWLILPLGFTSYAHYTLVHECVHGNIVRDRRFAWVHTLIGWYGSLMLFSTWPLLERTHKHHHSFVNTERDPDLYVKLSFPRLLLRNLISTLLQPIPILILKLVFRDRSLARGYVNADQIMTRSEKTQHHIANWLMCIAVWWLAVGGFGWVFVGLVYGMVFIAMNMLIIMFQWLPHHPFSETGRYSATRNIGFTSWNYLFLWQNWHLMHHLWPSVPFYNYQRLYNRLQPVLEEKGARHHEGLVPAHGPIVTESETAAE